MIVTITTTKDDCQYIQDLLENPLSGYNCLSGQKLCTDKHSMVPDILEFDLTEEEIDELRNEGAILSVECEEDISPELDYIKTTQTGSINFATYLSPDDSLGHHLHYCQTYDPTFINDTTSSTVHSIDCSNIDVVIMDSGVDPTHLDLFDDQGNPQVVDFDWTLLYEDDGVTQILPSMPANYNRDMNGHGTACASLVAGKRSGFAKNAKIYSLKSISTSPDSAISSFTALKLMLAFQKAKKLNQHGLDSSRPTVFSNSWGYVGPYFDSGRYGVAPSEVKYNFYWQYGYGSPQYPYNNSPQSPGISSTADGYMREIVTEGVHVLTSAGNSNTFLSDRVSVRCHRFSNADSNITSTYYSPVEDSDLNLYTANTRYISGVEDAAADYVYTSNNYSKTLFCRSPDIGDNDRDQYPVIIVGDVTPVGNLPGDASGDVYSSGKNVKAITDVLSSYSDPRIFTDERVRYNNSSEPLFVKTPYSSFGPQVDVYAPGNGAWAALSNDATTSGPTCTAESATYMFMNGTSSACPIAAGCLATYLSEFPTSTPGEARDWLISNGIKGNILETQASYLPTPVTSDFGTSTPTYTTLNIPFGPDVNAIRTNWTTHYRFYYAETYPSLAPDIEDLLYSCRFFESNNVMVQAYPLRKAVLTTSTATATINGTTLNRGVPSSERKTHTL